MLPPIAIRQGLVECLRSDDDLVRFAAIGALRDMTGGDRGYRYDDALALRELAIDQWIPWAGSPSQDASQSPAKGEPQIVAREAAR